MIKFHLNKVYKYTKSKSVIEIFFDVLAFGVLLPMAISGITFMIFALITGQIDTTNVTFGIYG